MSKGTELLASLEERDPTLLDPQNPIRAIALQAASVADNIERLDSQMKKAPVMYTTAAGSLAVNPMWPEHRAQSALLARLVTSLRLPDIKTGKRPQTRPMRGPNALKEVSSLEQARLRAGGE